MVRSVSSGHLPAADTTPAAWTMTTVPSAADESTRYLASAVHLDDTLADELVEETLSEPRRAIPPSPGVHTAAVLREAAAARARRRIVSLVLIVFILPMLFSASGLAFLLSWLAFGIVWRLVVALLRYWNRRRRAQGLGWWGVGRSALSWWSVLWLLVALTGLLPSLLGLGSPNASSAGPYYQYQSPSADSSNVLVTIMVVLLYLTLVVESLAVWRTVTSRFGYGRYQPASPVTEFVRWASRGYERRLYQITQATAQEGSDSVVVYRSHEPFVGSGRLVHSWSMALELRPQSGVRTDDSTPRFSPAQLHDFVTAEVMKLREAGTLTPGHRFAGLHMQHSVAVAAEALLHYAEALPLAEQLAAGGNMQIAESVRNGLVNSSPEWMRYYRCYRVESWERQMVVSAFLRVGCEERVLYLDWNGFVLPPIADAYQQVDRQPGGVLAGLGALWRSLGALLLLPTTLPRRLVELFRGLYRLLSQPTGVVLSPAAGGRVFGSAFSVRERGAGDELRSYLQETDADQYLKIMERRVLDAIHRFLVDKGISTERFDGNATRITHQTVINGGQFIASNVAGTGNTASVADIAIHSEGKTRAD